MVLEESLEGSGEFQCRKAKRRRAGEAFGRFVKEHRFVVLLILRELPVCFKSANWPASNWSAEVLKVVFSDSDTDSQISKPDR